jgi:acyl-CoA synthetase (AMP-forming)/AMP-acid ligase II
VTDVSFGTIWEGIADALPEAVAVRSPDLTLTYAQFDQRAARLAAALREHGAGPTSTVACYLYNCPQYLETVFAAFKLGAAPVNANYRYREAELTELLADADAEVLVYSASLADAVQHAAAHVPCLRLLVQVGPAALPAVSGAAAVVSYDEVQSTVPPLPRAARPGTDRLLMYTGGTTGRPKGVVWELGELMHGLAFATYGALGRPTPRTLAGAVDTAVAVYAEGQPRVSLPVVPLMHGTGLFNTFGTLLTAGEVIFTGGTSFDPDRVWQAVQTHRVTSLLIAGNAIARPLVDALAAAERAGRPYDLSSLRTIISSGTIFTDDLKAALHRRSAVTIYDGLAASEGGPFAFAVTASDADLPSQLRPVPGTMVIDAAGEPLAPGSDATGMLAFGGSLPLGYHKDPQRTASTYRTIQGRRCVVVGDYVRYEADGTLRFLGRDSGVINTGGEKVYPAEVEEALLAHPSVIDAVVVGEPDHTWGERVAAVVALGRDAAPITERELVDWLRPRLAGYKLPRRLLLVAALPRTPTGKLEVRRVRELLHEVAVSQ